MVLHLISVRTTYTIAKKHVEVGDFKSEEAAIITGVPQGSILGALLFIIYVNDIALSSDLFKFIIYADDTTLSNTLDKFQFSDGQLQSQNMQTVKGQQTFLKRYKNYFLFHFTCLKKSNR